MMGTKAMAAAAAAIVVAGCATGTLSRDERARLCRVEVATSAAEWTFEPNPLSNAGGGVVGGAGGGLAMGARGAASGIAALSGLAVSPGAILMVPIGVVIGAVYGTRCAAASLAHPTADADFQARMPGDLAALRTGCEVALQSRDPGCAMAIAGQRATGAPDTRVLVAKVAVRMSCLTDPMAYAITADWTAVDIATGRALGAAATHCAITSSLTVDEWFAQPERGRREIEAALAATGRRIAAELVAEHRLQEPCSLAASPEGEVAAQPPPVQPTYER